MSSSFIDKGMEKATSGKLVKEMMWQIKGYRRAQAVSVDVDMESQGGRN